MLLCLRVHFMSFTVSASCKEVHGNARRKIEKLQHITLRTSINMTRIVHIGKYTWQSSVTKLRRDEAAEKSKSELPLLTKEQHKTQHSMAAACPVDEITRRPTYDGTQDPWSRELQGRRALRIQSGTSLWALSLYSLAPVRVSKLLHVFSHLLGKPLPNSQSTPGNIELWGICYVESSVKLLSSKPISSESAFSTADVWRSRLLRSEGHPFIPFTTAALAKSKTRQWSSDGGKLCNKIQQAIL